MSMNKLLLRKPCKTATELLIGGRQILSANLKKFQVMLIGEIINPINSLMKNNAKVKPKTAVSLLGFVIDNKLYLKQHVDALCREVNLRSKIYTI